MKYTKPDINVYIIDAQGIFATSTDVNGAGFRPRGWDMNPNNPHSQNSDEYRTKIWD